MLSMLFSKFKGYIVGAGAVLAFVLSIYLKGRSAGRDSAEKEARDALEKDKSKAEEIRRDVDGMSGSELDSRLSAWTRKR